MKRDDQRAGWDSRAARSMLPPGQTDVRMDAVPALGAHTDAILTEFGYSAAQIDALRRDGAV